MKRRTQWEEGSNLKPTLKSLFVMAMILLKTIQATPEDEEQLCNLSNYWILITSGIVTNALIILFATRLRLQLFICLFVLNL